MTWKTKGVAAALTVMTKIGFNPLDNTTALIPAPCRDVDFAASLSSTSLKDPRIGVLNGLFNHENSSEVAPGMRLWMQSCHG